MEQQKKERMNRIKKERKKEVEIEKERGGVKRHFLQETPIISIFIYLFICLFMYLFFEEMASKQKDFLAAKSLKLDEIKKIKWNKKKKKEEINKFLPK